MSLQKSTEQAATTVYYLTSVFLYVIAAIFALGEATLISLILCLVAAVIAAWGIIKHYKQFFSLTIVFWIFSCLYSLTGVISIVSGQRFNLTFSTGNVNENITPFMVAYCVASIGFLIGCSSRRSLEKSGTVIIENAPTTVFSTMNISVLTKGAYISAFLCSLFEIINLYRVGGVSMLFVGKGLYQSAVGDLFLTLPSELVYSVCGMFVGMLLGNKKANPAARSVTGKIVFIVIFLSPFLFCKIILGMRGALVSAFLTGIACYSTVYPIRKISFKMCIAVFAAYVFLVFLYTNRSIVSLLNIDPGRFFELAFDFDRFASNFNPSSGEFGAALGNFCIFYAKYGASFPWRWGLTYLKGLVVPIPSFLFPGTKPQQITYEFRDEFFSSLAQRSRIASTGFSSILEAYMNWGIIGIFLVYLIVGFLITKIDHSRSRCNTILTIMLCSAFVNTCMDFSRSAFGGLWADYVSIAVLIVIIHYIAAHTTFRRYYNS